MAKNKSTIVHVITRDGGERPIDLMACDRFPLRLKWPTDEKGPPPPKYYYFHKPDFWFALLPSIDAPAGVSFDVIASRMIYAANFDVTSHVEPESEDAAFAEAWGASVARDFFNSGRFSPAVLHRFTRQAALPWTDFYREFCEWQMETHIADPPSAKELRARLVTCIIELRRAKPDLSNKEIAAMASRKFSVSIDEKYVSKIVKRHNDKARKGAKIPLKYKRKSK